MMVGGTCSRVGRTTRMRTTWRGTTAIGVTLAWLAIAAAPAFGEIRGGTATDPAGDSAGTPSQDITGATAQYDTNGQISVSATMNGDIPSGPASFYSFGIASYTPPSECTGASASIFGFSDSSSWLLTV